MKVISMVPSWTETLLECGVDVVGRTGYCIHPSDQVVDIPVLGGTKEIDWNEVADTGADLILLDKEENTREMADASPLPIYASHVESIGGLIEDLEALSARLDNAKLADLASEWRTLRASTLPPQTLQNLPGVLEWIKRPTREPEQFVYLIWRKPWMAVSHETFIGSVFDFLGLKARMWSGAEKYPEVDLAQFDLDTTLLLFSTEPYPFARKRDQIAGLGFPAALVDGEGFTWFGVRSLRFLQSLVTA